MGRGEERGRENTCFPVEEGIGKPSVSQWYRPQVAFVIKKSTFFLLSSAPCPDTKFDIVSLLPSLILLLIFLHLIQ